MRCSFASSRVIATRDRADRPAAGRSAAAETPGDQARSQTATATTSAHRKNRERTRTAQHGGGSAHCIPSENFPRKPKCRKLNGLKGSYTPLPGNAISAFLAETVQPANSACPTYAGSSDCAQSLVTRHRPRLGRARDVPAGPTLASRGSSVARSCGSLCRRLFERAAQPHRAVEHGLGHAARRAQVSGRRSTAIADAASTMLDHGRRSDRRARRRTANAAERRLRRAPQAGNFVEHRLERRLGHGR